MSDRTRREHDIVDVLMALGEGEVTTYGDVAAVAGHPRQARLVGRILATTDQDVAWWRVVDASGRLRAADRRLQAELLRAEGVRVRDERIVDAPIGRFSRRSRPAPGRSSGS